MFFETGISEVTSPFGFECSDSDATLSRHLQRSHCNLALVMWPRNILSRRLRR